MAAKAGISKFDLENFFFSINIVFCNNLACGHLSPEYDPKKVYL